MKTNTEEFRYRFRNPENSSVFRSELVAIREVLNLALDNRASDAWILTDSKSSIQFLKDWSNGLDMLGRYILLKLSVLTQVSSALSRVFAPVNSHTDESSGSLLIPQSNGSPPQMVRNGSTHWFKEEEIMGSLDGGI
ncbi:hypothetical protein TNCT_83361 [Trichonephila clavata]|uniref:RNase H type-1 domain-containing protein n=1 Tax=Trichonephila clavata TaxID=2740835 RepID=A0A8X6H609_TRICU|nr:hypothetical protein TNCT_83361 [Trichonephila clavata]